MSRFIQRLGRVFEALQVLDLYPNGITVTDLAEVIDTDPAELLRDLEAHNRGTEEMTPGHPAPFVEFLDHLPNAAEIERWDDLDESADPYVTASHAVAVRLYGGGPSRTGGGLTIADLGALLVTAEDLTRVEPDNSDLARIIAELRSRVLPGSTAVWRTSYSRRHEADLMEAISEHTKVRIIYERQWEPGVVERIIEPYALVRTHLGFEVDAGPVQDNGRIRSYLVNQIRDLERLDEPFERPANAEALCARNRVTTPVVVVVPADRAWVAERLADDVTVVQADDDVELHVELLEPLAERTGLLLLQAGPDALVSTPALVADADVSAARILLEHHGL